MNREEFGSYCLRKLGHPVINIEVDPQQVEDRIDDALRKFREYHYDARTEEYLSVELTSQIETDGYVTLDDNVYSVKRVLPVLNTANTTGGALFSMEYQFFINEFYNTSGITTGNLSNISSIRQYIETMSRELIPLVSFNFNKKTSRVFFNENMPRLRSRATYLIFEIERIVDPEEFPNVWEDEWLIEYTTSLIKKQWGQNVSKFGSLSLPGGIVINGEAIYGQAVEEIAALETRLINSLQPPLGVYVG
jgi:hypothetical protein